MLRWCTKQMGSNSHPLTTKGLRIRPSSVQKSPRANGKAKSSWQYKVAKEGGNGGAGQQPGFQCVTPRGFAYTYVYAVWAIPIAMLVQSSRSSPPDLHFWAVNQTSQAFQLSASWDPAQCVVAAALLSTRCEKLLAINFVALVQHGD